jgi:predicted dehydrogenase
VRAIVVGAGVMGRWHAHAVERLGSDVVGIVDSRRDAADRLVASHPGAGVYTDLGSALSDREVDVVHVCTPTGSHAELVRTALEGGAHVLVEKPLAGSLAETEELLELARARELALNPVHQFPFQPGFQRLLGHRDDLGDLVRVAYRTCSAGGENRSLEEQRAILVEILSHPVSLFRHLLGDAFDPAALAVVRHTDADLDLTGSLGDALLDVSISLRGRPTCNELLAVGTRATGLADLFHGYALIEGGRVSRVTKATRPFRLGGQLVAHAGGNLAKRGVRREPAYPGLRELVRRFYAAARGGGATPVPEVESLAAARLIERVRPAG